MSLLADLQAELDERAGKGLLRRRRVLQSSQAACIVADGRPLLSFASNDYLGLANHPAVIAALTGAAADTGAGSGASHLITGHHALHERLEHCLAQFVGLPAALLFSTGYMANLGIVSALVGRGDAIFADRLNHASLNDAAVLSRSDLQRYAHNDMQALEKLLAASKAKRKLVAADAVFSMDGDVAPVGTLLALCERYDAWLLLDDAHGFGVLGKRGAGILEHAAISSWRILYMATLGKAAGVAGAFVAGAQTVIDYLLQQARTYIYTTAGPPALAGATLAALDIIEHDAARRAHLHGLITLLQQSSRLRRWQWMPSQTAIQPLLVGSNEAALQLSEYMLGKGILVPAIRPPTVPANTARLRVSLSASHTREDVEQLVAALHEAEAEVAA